jgi:chromate transporter
LTDLISVTIALVTVLILLRFKKVQEPLIILAAAILGLLIKAWL